MLLITIIIQIPAIQDRITAATTGYLEDKLETKVEVKELRIRLPNAFVLQQFYLEDRQKDTLLYIDRLAVNIDFWGLLGKTIHLHSIHLEKSTVHLHRSLPDSSYNFDFIAESFAPENPSANQGNQETWDFSLDHIQLNHIRFTQKDEIAGTEMELKLGAFDSRIDEFNPRKETIMVKNIDLSNTIYHFLAYQSTPEPISEPAPFTWIISTKTLNLSNIEVEIDNSVLEQCFRISLGNSVEADSVRVNRQKISARRLAISNMAVNYLQDSLSADPERPAVQNQPVSNNAEGWEMALARLEMKNNSFIMEDLHYPEQEGIDFNHLFLDGIGSDVKDVFYSENLIKAQFAHFSMKEKNGFQLKNLIGRLSVDTNKASFSKLDLITGNSRIRDHLAIGYPSLEEIGQDPEKLLLRVGLNNTEVGFRDILYFQPDLSENPPFKENQNEKININGLVEGYLPRLQIHSLELSAGEFTTLALTGSATGLPKIDTTIFELNLQKLYTGDADIRMLASSTIPENIKLPSEITTTGNFKGSINDFRAQLDNRSDFGDVFLNLNMRTASETRYQLELGLNELNVGKILDQPDTLGPVTLTAFIEGKGLEMENLEAETKMTISRAVFLGYEYRDFQLQGKWEDFGFDGEAGISDPNLAFQFDGRLDFSDTIPGYFFTLHLDTANLQALNLTEEDIRVNARIYSDISGNKPDNLNGIFDVRDILVTVEKKPFPLDSFLLTAITRNGHVFYHIDSDLITAHLEGHFNLEQFPAVMQHHLNHYYPVFTDSPPPALPQDFNFMAELKQTEWLSEFLLPELQELQTGVFRANFDSKTRKLVVDMDIPRIAYADLQFDTLSIRIDSDREELRYFTGFREARMDTFRLNRTSLEGRVKEQEVQASLRMLDNLQQINYLIAGKLNPHPEGHLFRFIPGMMILNQEPWQIAEDNRLLFTGKGLSAREVHFESRDRFFGLETKYVSPKDSLLDISFGNFELATFTQLLENGKGLLNGKIDGDIQLDIYREHPAFTSDVLVSNFSFMNEVLGHVSIQASNPTPDRYDLLLRLYGMDNELNAEGYYLADEETPGIRLDMDMDFHDLSRLEPYTLGELRQLEGRMNGNVSIAGTLEHPVLTGSFQLERMAFILDYLNAHLRISEQQLILEEEGIRFPELVMADTLGNTAMLDGMILTSDYRNYQFDLHASTQNFLLLNTMQEAGDLYYGKVIISSELDIKGDLNSPVITAEVSVEEGTNITVEIPETEIAAAERKGVVEFIDRDQEYVSEEEEEELLTTGLTGMDLSATITVNEQAGLKIIVDPRAGDYLDVRGGGIISMGIDPAGNINLSGRYEITEGQYLLTFYNVVRREFEIAPGSNILWVGEPLEAQVDITAIHTTSTAPVDLVSGMLAGAGPEEINAFRRRMSFLVFLNMNGELLMPEISFDIELSERERAGEVGRTVQSRLLQLREDEAEMNKQVFALLILGSFIPDEPVETDNGGSDLLAGAARSSVSRLLTNQLNVLSQKYLAGVELEVAVESFEPMGETAEGRTEVMLGLSKELFDERVVVNIGGTVDVEGRARERQRLSDIAGDVSVEYLLTEDGVYRIKAFRETEFEGMIEGEVIETGIAVIFSRDYNQLIELLRRKINEEEEPIGELVEPLEEKE